MKLDTHNEYHKQINKVVDYINFNLTKSIDLKSLADIANISEFHFHRIFKAFIGEPLGAYLTRLRLESAAQKLRTTKFNLEQIAEKTGYQSQHSLSKAFKKHFGITPTAFRNIETFWGSKHKKEETILLDIEPIIKELDKKEFVYIRIISKYGSDEEYALGWKKIWDFAKQNSILDFSNEYLGLSFDDPNITKENKCRFYACITTNKKIKPSGEFGISFIEKGKYAIFTLKGDYSGLQKLYNYIYCNWLPNCPYKLRNTMPFEKYLNNPDKVKKEELLTEIYIPII